MAKTIHVQKIKNMANQMLENKNLSDGERKGVAALLEKILFETDNYGGFGYVEWLKEGRFKNWLESGSELPEVEPFLGNQTRKIYF